GLWAQLRLEEAGGGLQEPGGSAFLSCCTSGFSFRCYPVWWFRHAPRGSLEWVSFIDYLGHGQNNTAAVQDRATAFRDNSLSEASLSLQDLHPQDSAQYFCAIHTG
ncbi:HVC33 protein, partial [Sapayoa aenigma]|nr:HVC33 protein [Sapayoa aenigma]